ncbi:MAG: hypothetical protein U1C74_14775 [Phenylobacterium sp.]|nr:hypothetical protein [Phenylobacterium sp.]
MSEAPTPRWSRHGGPGQALPFADADAAGSSWTDLANSPEGRAACGWAPAPVPAEVTMAQARGALREFDLLTPVDAFVAAQGPTVRTEWFTRTTVRRNAALLAACAAQMGWSEAFLDELFHVAAAIPSRS